MSINTDNDSNASCEEKRDILNTEDVCRNSDRRHFLAKFSVFLTGASALAWVGFSYRNQLHSFWGGLGSRKHDVQSNNAPVKKSNLIPNQKDVRNYRSYLAKYELTYLSADEILRPHFKLRSGVCSGVPPKRLWANMRDTARVANEIRHRLGVPLHTVVSAYRSPQYNAKCPGASRYSQHLHNRALDLIYACPPKAAFDVAVKLRDEGFFKGGIGLYSNFIHIDTRGRNATWGV